ncbi:hypothetical protein [Corynebacterium aquilae]|uniref:Uncharacterized protein n=1 Tax=Corynebacterium aquilae DSM 44791 TaxID=1431546 RepID=A0A1L7CFD8_9CORY|nr:hypothetical protein [Corynebacterium aquilae]APT84544.1 hypothetical protein CAQU_05145 [Corynebacterium aquilae DSM 44791]
MTAHQNTYRPLSTATSVVREGGSLFVRFFPALLTCIALGLAARGAVLWTASAVSDYSPLFGGLLVPLAPMSLLTALVIAMWVLKPGTRFLKSKPVAELDPHSPKSPRATIARTHLLTIGGLLIPFLAVYASNGFLKEDVHTFIGQAVLHEQVTTFASTDFSRVALGSTFQVAALVVITIIARKIIGFFALGTSKLGISGVAAYVEVLWISAISVIVAANTSAIKEWTSTRAVIAPVLNSIAETFSGLSNAESKATGGINAAGALLGKLDDVIVVPVAWLALGAVVFGSTLAAKKTSQATAQPADSTTEAASQTDARTQWARSVRARATGEAQRYLANATKPITGPITSTWTGLKKIAAAGIIPMTTLCLAIMCARVAESAIAWGVHEMLGPQFGLMVDAQASWTVLAGRMAYFLVVIPLVVAGVDQLLLESTSEDSGN